MQEKIQNIHQKFNAPQNEIRLAIMNFIVDNHRPFSLKEDGYTALKGITLSSAEDFSSITEASELRVLDAITITLAPPAFSRMAASIMVAVIMVQSPAAARRSCAAKLWNGME